MAGLTPVWIAGIVGGVRESIHRAQCAERKPQQEIPYKKRRRANTSPAPLHLPNR